MHSDLVELGWTEEHFNRIDAVVTEEAQKARIAAQMLAVVGTAEPTAVAVPSFQLNNQVNPRLFPPATPPLRLSVDSDPTLHLTKIAVNVAIRTRDARDPNLDGVLTMFRRAANYVARLEDALIFNGRAPAFPWPFFPPAGIQQLYELSGNGLNEGIFPVVTPQGLRSLIPIFPGAVPGNNVVTAITQAITALEANGQSGPFACALSSNRFDQICNPNANLVLPRDRILPFLQGPLLRASAILPNWGVVIALSGNPLELVVASDIHVRYLQTTEEPRVVFQVSERVALRIKELAAIAMIQ